LEFLEQALQIDAGLERPYLMLNKARVLEGLGDYSEAIAVLLEATPMIESEGEPRFLLILRSNLAVNLCLLDRYSEAEELLPGLKRLAAENANALDLVRLLWLEGRIAAGLGRREEATVSLSRVREEFISRGIAYDVALVSLELAVLYLQEGRTTEVRALARQLGPILQVQGLHREALAALTLFRDAAEREAVTLDLARRLVTYLLRAQFNPELRFEN
jgi:tetratricopeptide (TPR) repeat protein